MVVRSPSLTSTVGPGCFFLRPSAVTVIDLPLTAVMVPTSMLRPALRFFLPASALAAQTARPRTARLAKGTNRCMRVTSLEGGWGERFARGRGGPPDYTRRG